MANDTRNRQEQSSQERTTTPRTNQRGDTHGSDPYRSPFSLMRLGLDEMDRWYGRVIGDRSWASSNWSPASWRASSSPRDWMASIGNMGDWAPPVEAFQRGNDFIVRAELPGMSRPELNVEIGDDTITISGERKSEQRNEKDGLFWTERSYGSFCRTIPLPPGAISESAKATFNNGVLEVIVQAPSQEARRGRKIDISGQPHDTK